MLMMHPFHSLNGGRKKKNNIFQIIKKIFSFLFLQMKVSPRVSKAGGGRREKKREKGKGKGEEREQRQGEGRGRRRVRKKEEERRELSFKRKNNGGLNKDRREGEKKSLRPKRKKEKIFVVVVVVFSPPTLPLECHSAVARSLLDSQTASCSFFPISHVFVALLSRVIICRTSNVPPTFSNSRTIYAPSSTYFQN